MAVKPIPDGFHTITPYICVNGAAKAIAFYQEAFGAQEIFRMEQPDGKIGHAEIQIGDSRLMLADEFPEMDFRGPGAIGGTPVMIHLYVKDADATFAAAVAAGAKSLRPVADQFYGDRGGSLTDPWGHSWYVATHKEDVTPEELAKRAAALHGAEQTPAK